LTDPPSVKRSYGNSSAIIVFSLTNPPWDFTSRNLEVRWFVLKHQGLFRVLIVHKCSTLTSACSHHPSGGLAGMPHLSRCFPRRGVTRFDVCRVIPGLESIRHRTNALPRDLPGVREGAPYLPALPGRTRLRSRLRPSRGRPQRFSQGQRCPRSSYRPPGATSLLGLQFGGS
jgi:hypothetical protein